LSDRLKELEAEGLVVRDVTPSTPVSITYSLTEKGESLMPVVRSLADWAEAWMPAPDAAPTVSAAKKRR
jgi:DNA-binding HxlR family transcriptional regulator